MNSKINNELLYNLKNIPKGAIHHAHFSGYVRYNLILDLLEKKYKNKVIFLHDKKYLSFGNTKKKIDFSYLRELVKKSKYNFSLLGGMFYNIIKNILFIDDYFDLIIKEMDEDKIMHIDLRLRLGSYFKNNERNKLSIIDELKLFKRQQDKFKKKGKSFSIIVTASKREPFSRIKKKLEYIDSLKNFDDLIFGYDIVGDELQGNKLSYYGKKLIKGLNKPFFFHAGEIKDSFDNLSFAINNGGDRIAHGIHIIKHEKLLKKIIKKKIVLEICPISNIKLGVVDDPLIYKKLLDKGVLLSISPDDPNKLGDKNLFDNFIFLLEKGNFSIDDIYKCIIVSINRSLTTEERIKEMKNKFNKKIKKYNLKGGQKSKKRISSYFNGRIIYDGINNKTIYYQDLKKKWKFYTDEVGLKLLLKCYKKIKLMLIENLNLIKKSGKNIQDTIKDGYFIYKNKLSLKKNSSSYGSGEYVTWTDDEYSHLGLQRFYLTVKGLQRFTETWSLLERSCNYGIFKNIPIKINIVSIGGGPGFECYAFELFIKRYFPNVECHFYICDLENKWGDYIDKLGDNYHFFKWDLYKNDIFKVTNLNTINFVIISAFFVMYMENEYSYNLLKNLFDKGVKSIFINSRAKKIAAKEKLIKKNIFTTNLIEENDDRQIVFSLKKYKKKHYLKNIFPNVPFLVK